MDWQHLSSEHAIEEITELSKDKPVFVFKHSPTCSISALVLNRVEKNFRSENLSFIPIIVDVIKEKTISAAIAQKWHVHHESPQALFIQDGNCTYSASHMNIILKSFPNT